MSFVDGIAAWLGSSVDGLAYSETTDEGNVFVDQVPAGPDRCVVVMTQPGAEPDSRLPYDPVNFQVLARSDADGRWAAATLDAVYNVLHGRRNTELPGGTYLVFALATQGSPFRLGTDDSGRMRYTQSYRGETFRPTAERSA